MLDKLLVVRANDGRHVNGGLRSYAPCWFCVAFCILLSLSLLAGNNFLHVDMYTILY